MRVVWTITADVDDLPGDDLVEDAREATCYAMERVALDYLFNCRELSLYSDVTLSF